MQGHVVEYQGQQVAFDQQGQLDKITESLMPGEQVLAVYDAIGAGTGFIGVTDKRVIIQDNSYVGKKIALVSIPFSRISSVSVLSNKSMFGHSSRPPRSRSTPRPRRTRSSSVGTARPSTSTTSSCGRSSDGRDADQGARPRVPRAAGLPARHRRGRAGMTAYDSKYRTLDAGQQAVPPVLARHHQRAAGQGRLLHRGRGGASPPGDPVADGPRPSATGEPKGLDIERLDVEKFAKLLAAVAIGLYVVGLLGVNSYLFSLGASDFTLTRARFVYTGVLISAAFALTYFGPLGALPILREAGKNLDLLVDIPEPPVGRLE
jgi:hypothetical protein